MGWALQRNMVDLQSNDKMEDDITLRVDRIEMIELLEVLSKMKAPEIVGITVELIKYEAVLLHFRTLHLPTVR